MDERRPLRTYGRIKARTLKPRQEALLETLLPHLAVPADGEIDVEALFSEPPPPRGAGAGGPSAAPVFADISASARPPTGRFAAASPARGEGLILEIGFGGGEHLVAQASAHPEQRFIGVEPFLNGVASCLRHIEERFLLPLDGGGGRVAAGGGARAGGDDEASRGATAKAGGPHSLSHAARDSSPIEGEQVRALNIRLHQGDARDVIARLPDASLDRVYILFPDPWPKARHHKRRLIQPEFLSELARVMKPGAELRFATDWANYAAWTLEHCTRDARFTWLAERAEDWRTPWPGHATTRYEAKKLGDCAPIWLRFVRA